MEKKEIEHLASLARIAITEDEVATLAKDMTSILNYVSEIEKIAGSREQEKEVGPLHNVLREDGDPHEGGKYSEELLRLAPIREGDYIKVKKILGEST